MIDVLLVSPNSKFVYQELAQDFSAVETPIWCGLLANSVISIGKSAEIVDLNIGKWTNESFCEHVKYVNPKFVMFVATGANPNSSSSDMAGAVNWAEQLKLVHPEYKIGFVGPHVNALPMETLSRHNFIDFCITNEGVYALRNLVSGGIDRLESVRGLAYRKDNVVHLTQPENIVPQDRLCLDLPGVAYDLMPSLYDYRTSHWHTNYHDTRSPFASIYTSLGCSFTCLAGDTPVDTIYGSIPIKELAEKYKTVPVYTMDFKTNMVKIADAINISKTGVSKKLVRVKFDDGTHIDCTPDHKFMCEWVSEASRLTPGTIVRAINYCNQDSSLLVVSVEEIDGLHDVYCMTVPGHGWFYANKVLVKNCSFCMINIINRTENGEDKYAGLFNKFRHWEPEFTISQLDYLANKGVRNIKIADELFLNSPKSHAMPLCDLIIDRGYDFNIWCYTRVNTVKQHHLEKLKRAGVNYLAIGIENSLQKVRTEIEKGKFSDVNIVSVVKMIEETGINVIQNFIVGLPGETAEDAKANLQFAQDLNCSAYNVYPSMALPGSQLYVEARNRGEVLPEQYTQFGFLSYDCLPLSNGLLSSEEILRIRDDNWTSYHTSDRFLSSIEHKFGKSAIDNIKKMTAVPLKRKLLND